MVSQLPSSWKYFGSKCEEASKLFTLAFDKMKPLPPFLEDPKPQETMESIVDLIRKAYLQVQKQRPDFKFDVGMVSWAEYALVLEIMNPKKTVDSLSKSYFRLYHHLFSQETKYEKTILEIASIRAFVINWFYNFQIGNEEKFDVPASTLNWMNLLMQHSAEMLDQLINDAASKVTEPFTAPQPEMVD